MKAIDKGVNVGVAPVTYGQGDRPPRGDYGRAGADYTCEQRWADYTIADHETYRRLYTRQLEQLPGSPATSSSPRWASSVRRSAFRISTPCPRS